jgi:hypothetical protein
MTLVELERYEKQGSREAGRAEVRKELERWIGESGSKERRKFSHSCWRKVRADVKVWSKV